MNKNIILSLMFICMLSFTVASAGYGYGYGYGTEETPVIKKSSSGGIIWRCTEWSECENGVQTKTCNENAVVTRPCEMNNTVKIINNSYVKIEDLDKVDIPKPNTNVPSEIEPEKESNKTLWISLAVIILLIVVGTIAFLIQKED